MMTYLSITFPRYKNGEVRGRQTVTIVYNVLTEKIHSHQSFINTLHTISVNSRSEMTFILCKVLASYGAVDTSTYIKMHVVLGKISSEFQENMKAHLPRTDAE